MIHYSNVLHNVLIILKYKNFLGYGCYQKIIIGKKQLRQRKLPKNHNWHFFYTDVFIDSFMWNSMIIEGISVFSCGATQYMVLCVRMSVCPVSVRCPSGVPRNIRNWIQHSPNLYLGRSIVAQMPILWSGYVSLFRFWSGYLVSPQ